jgi:hypothetical protein
MTPSNDRALGSFAAAIEFEAQGGSRGSAEAPDHPPQPSSPPFFLPSEPQCCQLVIGGCLKSQARSKAALIRTNVVDRGRPDPGDFQSSCRPGTHGQRKIAVRAAFARCDAKPDSGNSFNGVRKRGGASRSAPIACDGMAAGISEVRCEGSHFGAYSHSLHGQEGPSDQFPAICQNRVMRAHFGQLRDPL